MKTKVIAMLAILAICASSVSCSNDYYLKENEKDDEIYYEHTQTTLKPTESIIIETQRDEVSSQPSLEVIPPVIYEEYEKPQLNISDAYQEEQTSEEEATTKEVSKEDEEVVEEIMYKLVGLTFDDGPGKYTIELLKALKESGSTATFFLVGNRLNTYSEAANAIDDYGCEVAIHTYSHTSFPELGVEGTLEEINKTKSILEEMGIEYSNLIRPPYGSVNDTIKEGVDFPMILWNVDTRDWESKDADKVCEEILKGIEEGNIILLHDIHKTTIEGVIKALEQMPKGYKFVSISELANAHGYTFDDGNCYYSLRLK